MAVLYILTPLLESACDAFDSNLLIPSNHQDICGLHNPEQHTLIWHNSILEFLHTNVGRITLFCAVIYSFVSNALTIEHWDAVADWNFLVPHGW